MTSDHAARRLGLLDIMILVAATAIGLGGAAYRRPRAAAVVIPRIGIVARAPATPKPRYVATMTGYVTRPVSGYSSTRWMRPAAEHLVPLLPVLAAWIGAYLIARLRSPRPRLRRLLAQPGLSAALAVLATLVIEATLLVGSAWVDGRSLRPGPRAFTQFTINGEILLAHHAGWAVAIAWATQALVGRWRPEPSWLDRSGRLLGSIWIALGVLASLLVDQTPWWGNFLGS